MQCEECHEWGFDDRLDIARARRAYSEKPGGYRGLIHDSPYLVNDADAQILDSHVVDATHRARIQGFKDYLVMCEGRNSISALVHDRAWTIWEKMSNKMGGALEVPDACPGASGELLLTWDKDSDHFEVEVESNLYVSLFYVNSKKNLSWESATTANAPIDNETEQILRIFQLPIPPARAFAAGTAPRNNS